MKVIARSNNGLIVEIDDTELARVCGFAFCGDVEKELGEKAIERSGGDHYRSGYPRFKVGAQISVSPMWDWMTKAREQFDKIKNAANQVRAAAVVLDMAPPSALVEPKPEGEAS